MQYFAQDEADPPRSDADRLPDARRRSPRCTWCRASATSSAASCSRATTSTSRCGVLSGGERTRLAVARMLLRPSNTLLLDEPTNHLDLDSKDVLLEALEDFGGTLIFVSHDRYFVDRLATKIIEIGDGEALLYPGTYEEFLWSTRSTQERAVPRCRERVERLRQPRPPKGQRRAGAAGAAGSAGRSPPAARHAEASETPQPRRHRGDPRQTSSARRTTTASATKPRRGRPGRRWTPGGSGSTTWKRASPSASRPSRRSRPTMAAPGFYDNHETAKADYRQASDADVGSRRPDAPVGRAATDRSVVDVDL